ncbi:hypothetical protein SADUNF_Sadunf05G0100000 [Salix dunnii]|uniref:Uncharacterized protein n=1 Tax=Salix dunnii TaxID=1413687 RepID=A0A835KAG7_9ROSI|nr:hypothetical protein SADUNF_Sadunf05G0100000 [Salix dunnii]
MRDIEVHPSLKLLSKDENLPICSVWQQVLIAQKLWQRFWKTQNLQRFSSDAKKSGIGYDPRNS